jgi:hypothetical protein
MAVALVVVVRSEQSAVTESWKQSLRQEVVVSCNLVRLVVTLLLPVFLFFGSAPARAQTTIPVIEYYHAVFDHYFMTGIADEITKLDNGTFAGWARTGQQFLAYPLGTVGTVPTCRFFSTAFGSKSSHFYTPNAAECTVVKANHAWQFEAEVFGVASPSAAGACVTGTRPLYRLYNNGKGGAPNHRYTTDLTIRSGMIAKGWIPEGSGALGVIACMPASPAVTTAEGMWAGNASTGANIVGFVLNTGVFYFLYSTPYTTISGGVIQGNASTTGSSFTSSNARDFSFIGQGVYPSTITGSFVPQTSLAGTASSQLGTATFALAYQAQYEQPASLANAAGVYAGTGSTSLGNQQVTFSLGSGGAIVGSAPGCSFTGAASPHGTVNVFDVSIKFGGGSCLFGTATLTGIGFYDATLNRLYAVAPNAGRSDGFLFIGTKP